MSSYLLSDKDRIAARSRDAERCFELALKQRTRWAVKAQVWKEAECQALLSRDQRCAEIRALPDAEREALFKAIGALSLNTGLGMQRVGIARDGDLRMQSSQCALIKQPQLRT